MVGWHHVPLGMTLSNPSSVTDREALGALLSGVTKTLDTLSN